jgi:hypothetical protein
LSINGVIKFRRLNFDLSSNTTSSSSSGILFDKPQIPLLPPYHRSIDNCSSEKTDDYVDIESHNQYENDSLHVKRPPSLSSTTSISTCSPTTTTTTAHHRSNPIISPIYSHDQRRSRKRSHSPSTTDEESIKRHCSTTNSRPIVKNDLRNIESLIERVPEKPTLPEPSPTIDPNYLYLFYMAQFHNHQKTSLLHPHALQRYLLYNQQQLQNYYYYPSSLTNTK